MSAIPSPTLLQHQRTFTQVARKRKKKKKPGKQKRGELFLTFSRSDAQQRDEEKPAQHGQHRGRRSGQPRSAPSPSLCAPQPRDQGVKLRAEESPESLGEEEEEDEECAPQGRSVRFDVRRKWGFLKKKKKKNKESKAKQKNAVQNKYTLHEGGR